MKRIAAILAAVLALTLIGGCGSSNVPVKITNDLGAWNIEEIYIDPSDSPWGENRISSILEPGEDVTIRVPGGTYDIRLVDEDGDTYTVWQVEVGTSGYDWAVTLSDMD